MYQDKIGQYDMARQRRVMPNRTQSAAPIKLPEENRGGRLCDGSLPQDNGRNRFPEGRRNGWGIENYPLAMVYSPYQLFKQIYDPDKALSRGTMFAELDLPFEGDHRKGRC